MFTTCNSQLATKSGFTLVELSIVLVIIGLLIGGILVGQSLIDSAKVNAFVRQIQQMDIAVSNFKTKYKSLPGDTNKITPLGDGDGIIEDASNLGNSVFFTGETSNFWVHLNISGFMPQQSFTNTITTTFNSSSTTLNAPYAKIGGKASVVIGIPVPARPNTYLIANYQQIDSAKTFFSGPGGTANPAGIDANAIRSLDLLAIDKKIDDKSLVFTADKKAYAYYYDSVTQRPCTLADEKCYYYINILNAVGQ